MQMKPLILVTNDDGYTAPGIAALIEAVEGLGEIVVVAPESGASGMSHAVTIKTPLRSELVSHNQIPAYKVNGTPVDCIKLAHDQILDRKPDYIVSGINHGSNSSVSVVYSGTMGAAIEGAIHNIPSIGFSLCSHAYDADFSLATKYAREVFQNIIENGLPDHTCLNVNFPNISEAAFKGMKVCRQANGAWKEEFEKRKDPHGGTYYWLTGYFTDNENGCTDTDEWALANNYASIVPIKTDYTHHESLDALKKIF